MPTDDVPAHDDAPASSEGPISSDTPSTPDVPAFRVGVAPGLSLSKWGQVWAERRRDTPLVPEVVDGPAAVTALHEQRLDAALRRLGRRDDRRDVPRRPPGHARLGRRGARLAAGHGAVATLAAPTARGPERLVLIGSFHPSRQNTHTGRVTAEMYDALFARAWRLALS